MTTFTNLSVNQRMKRTEISQAFFGAFIDKIIGFNFPYAVGLITFGMEVKYALPITRNFEYFCKSVGSLDKCEGATACWDAIDVGAEKILEFKRDNFLSLASNCCFRLLCLTDGEDNRSRKNPLEVLSKLKTSRIIFDLFPIEGAHDLARAVANCSGGHCFQVSNIEQGLQLFQSEAVLCPNLRDTRNPVGINPRRGLTDYVAHHPYTDKPTIRQPRHLYTPFSKFKDSPSTRGSHPSIKRIMHELKSCTLSPPTPFEVFALENNISLWKIIYHGEHNTPYAGHSWLLFCTFGDSYPSVPPDLRFITPIYHLNVSLEGKICHGIFGDDWNPDTTMHDLFYLVSNVMKIPNTLNSLDSLKLSLYNEDKNKYLQQATQASRSCPVPSTLRKQFKLF
eukprot:TRINITY_DN8060_c0_g1_i2.p1 TRINITY_DN8060_c0_g1~~TRINITY_DN8060_c0_g1_i2.p1  ORF type:complete len:394 (+),score=59.16 TRINITY_DN8060_c0_g1_i2:231-1412(+)